MGNGLWGHPEADVVIKEPVGDIKSTKIGDWERYFSAP
jgi:hypothetical protein